MRVVSTLLLLSGVLVTTAVAGPARAQPRKPTSTNTEYSPYEKEAIVTTLAEKKLQIDPAPEGKVIGEVFIERLEILEPRDPGPELLAPIPVVSALGKVVTKTTLNSIHVLTKEWIIRREMLLRPGEEYIQVVVDETARNMRARMPVQVSLVVLVPVQSKEPGKVDILVITKDIWSLRLSTGVSITPGGLENLLLVPQETNFLGLQHTVSATFQLQPQSYTLGVGYKVPRFGQSWIGASAGASITMNRVSGQPEGSSASLAVSQPLYSTRTDWAWSADANYAVGIARRYSNAHVFLLDPSVTPDIHERIPYEYRSRSLGATAAVSRSFGWAIKNNFQLSFNASTASYDTLDQDTRGVTPVALQSFRNFVLPRGESRVYPALSWNTFTTNFLRTINVNTLSLQEDFRLGHSASVVVYPVSQELGSTRSLIGVSAGAGYTVAVGDGIAGISGSWLNENQLVGGDGRHRTTDAALGGTLGFVSPRFLGIGRIVVNATANNRYDNYLNSRSFLGGDGRLRGYPTAFFTGKDTVVYNLEYRSTPIEILKASLGAVAFYDGGDAMQGTDNFKPKQSVGFGFRALLPQINRLVFRVDFAFPLNRGPFPETGTNTVVDPFGFYLSFDQAFSP